MLTGKKWNVDVIKLQAMVRRRHVVDVVGGGRGHGNLYTLQIASTVEINTTNVQPLTDADKPMYCRKPTLVHQRTAVNRHVQRLRGRNRTGTL